MPKGTKKIEFEYEKKSNFLVTENGVYADSTLLKIEFPYCVIKLKTNPKDSTLLTGFIELNDISKEDKNKLASIVYHSNEIIKGEYKFDKEKAKYSVSRDDNETKKVFKILNIDYPGSFYFKYEINYKKQKKEVFYPNVSYLYPFKDVENEVDYVDNTNGLFKKQIGNKLILQNTILINENLDKKVTYDIFTNNNFGVQKTVSIYDTITLNSVTYK